MKSKLSKIFTSALIAASLICGAVSGKDNAGAMFSAVAFAAENSGECGASALWDFDSAHGILTISGTEAVSDYSDPTNAPWYSLRNDITQIVISEGITGVGKMSFGCCAAAECLTLPTTLTTFGTWAFNGCNKLTHINIPTGKTYVDYMGKGSLPYDSESYVHAFDGTDCTVCRANRLIDAIGGLESVTCESRSAIDLALRAYNMVPIDCRKLVKNSTLLFNAEIIAYYIPQNVRAAVSGSNVTITWQAVNGAEEYKVVNANTGEIIEHIASGDIVRCDFVGKESLEYNLVVYAGINGEWGRPSDSVKVIIDKSQTTVMGSGIITTGDGIGESRLESGIYNTPLFFDNAKTVIGYSEDGSKSGYVKINSDFTCTGSLKINSSMLSLYYKTDSVPITWAIGDDLELDNLNWNFMNYDAWSKEPPITVIVGGNMYLDGITKIPNTFEVFVAGDVYVGAGMQISCKLWTAGSVYLMNNSSGQTYVNSSNLYVGGKVVDTQDNSYPFEGNYSPLDKTSAEWIEAEETLKAKTSSPTYTPIKIFEDNDTPDHVSLRFNTFYIDYSENEIYVPGNTRSVFELSIDTHPNGVIIDEIIDYGDSSSYGNPYGFIIDTGNDPQNIFRIQVQPNIDSDGDGIKDTFSWTPYYLYDDVFADSPYILVKGRGTVIIDVPDGVTYQAAEHEVMIHANWYAMMTAVDNAEYNINCPHLLDSRDLDNFIESDWIHTYDACNGVCHVHETYDENGTAYMFCEYHQRRVKPSEIVNGCGCNGVVDTMEIDRWLGQNISSLSPSALETFFDEDGEVIYPNLNIIINAGGENSRINPFSNGSDNTFCGWIYAPAALCSSKTDNEVYNTGIFYLGGIIASEFETNDECDFYYCKPDETAINLIKSYTKPQVLANIAEYKLSYQDEIGLVFCMELNREILTDTSAQMNFTLNGKTITIPVADAASVTINEKQVYSFTCPVAAAEMADEIHAQIVTDTYESEVFTYSIQQYISDNYAGFRENYHEISEYIDYYAISAMLNYGDAAQRYFGHNADNPANNALDESDRGVPGIDASTLSEYKLQIQDNRKNRLFVGQAITLNNRMTIKLYFKSTLSLNDFAVTCEDGTVDSSRLSVTNDGNRTILAIKDITPGDFGKSFTVTVGDVIISNISVFSYAEQVLSLGINELYDIAAALVNYNDCVIEAKQYDMQTDEIISA